METRLIDLIADLGPLIVVVVFGAYLVSAVISRRESTNITINHPPRRQRNWQERDDAMWSGWKAKTSTSASKVAVTETIVTIFCSYCGQGEEAKDEQGRGRKMCAKCGAPWKPHTYEVKHESSA